MQSPDGDTPIPPALLRDLADLVTATGAASGDRALSVALGRAGALLDVSAARIALTCGDVHVVCELSAGGETSRREDPPARGAAPAEKPRVVAAAEAASDPDLAGTALVGPGVTEVLIVPVDQGGAVGRGVFARTGPRRFGDADIAVARIVVATAALKVATAGSVGRSAPPAGVTAGAAPAAVSPRVKPPASAIRILVAEDNPINQRLIVRILNRLGHQADVAGNGVEVLEAVAQQRYDVVFMDVQMPKMGGIEATRHIVDRMPGDTRPKVVAMTANASGEDRDACLAAGMDDYLCKPIRLSDVESALTRWTAR